MSDTTEEQEPEGVVWDETNFAPGMAQVVPDLPAEYYHADHLVPEALRPAISASRVIKAHRRGLSSVLWDAQHPAADDKTSAAFRIGSGMHAYVLRQHDWESEISVIQQDDFRTKAAKDQRDGALLDGRIPLLKKEIYEMRLMVEVLHRPLEQFGGRTIYDTLFSRKYKGLIESSIYWRSLGEGSPMHQCRPDFMPNTKALTGGDGGFEKSASVVDYKTTADLAKWEKTELWDRLGGIRMAHYYRGICALHGVKKFRHIHLVQEKTPPYQVGLFVSVLDPEPEVKQGEKEPTSSTILKNGLKVLDWADDNWRKALVQGRWAAPKLWRNFTIPGPSFDENAILTLDEEAGERQ